jgi:hypothetical protein
MKHQRLVLTVAALLALIWSGVAVVMYLTNDQVSWPARVIGLLEKAPWLGGEKLSPEARLAYLNQVIRNTVLLDLDQSKHLREEAQPQIDRFFASLTPEEQKEYVNRTVERYFDVIGRGLKAMPPEERKRVVGRIRGDMRNFRSSATDADRLTKQDQELLEFVVGDDPILFLRGLPIKQKMELAPVIEEMQSRMQGRR